MSPAHVLMTLTFLLQLTGCRKMNCVRLTFLPRSLQKSLTTRRNLLGIISNSGWLFADKLFRLGVGLTLGVLIARYLGPETFGLLSYSIAFVSLFSTIATLGLDGVVVRDLVVYPEKKNVILGSAFGLKVAGGTFAYAIALGSIVLIRPSDHATILLVAIIAGGMLFQAFDTLDLWFQSQLLAKYAVLARGSVFAFVSAAKIWLLYNHASVYAFAWVGVIEAALVGGALIIAFVANGNSTMTLRIQWSMARRLLNHSLPLAISGMFVLLTMQLDKIILGELSGNSEVGIYGVATQLSSAWYMVPMIIGSSIAPSLARAHAIGDPNYPKTLQTVYTVLSRISVLTAIAVFLLSDLIIGQLFGSEYQRAAPVLAIHIWGGIFIFHVSIRTRALIAEGRQRYITAIAALTLLSNVALTIILVRHYGALGAAYASLISWWLCAMVFPALWSETRGSIYMFLNSIKVRNPK